MRFFLGLVIGGILGVVVGGGGMLVVYPFLFPPPVVNETVSVAAGLEIVDEISLRTGVAGQDAGHWGMGDIKVYRNDSGNYLVEFQANFEVGPGPNFWLYTNTRADVNEEDDFNSDTDRKKIAKIKSFTGSQIYEIPAADMSGSKALTIWCETFGQYIASANLDLATT